MTMRQRIEVNLDELDQIIDRSTRAPLSESEGQKLKTALHAMAEKLVRKRSTEKTQCRSAAGCGARRQAGGERVGSGRSWAQQCRCVYGRQSGCRRTRHASLRRPVSGVPRGKSLPPEGAGNAGPVRGTRPAGSDRIRDGATALQRLRGGLHRRRTGDGGCRTSTMRRPWR